MSELNQSPLDEGPKNVVKRRRDLLPIWIKIFTWIFIGFGILAPVCLVLGLFGINLSLSLYGFESNEPLSLTGLTIILLFGIKGITAFGLWTEKQWAVSLAIADALLGIAICVVMLALPFFDSEEGFALPFRLELFVLVPYLYVMNRIRAEWLHIL